MVSDPSVDLATWSWSWSTLVLVPRSLQLQLLQRLLQPHRHVSTLLLLSLGRLEAASSGPAAGGSGPW